MKSESLLFLSIFIGIVILVLGVEVAGDRGYVLRLVQQGGHETIYLLIGTILGLVLRDASSLEGRLALIAAVGAAVSGMFLGAFQHLEHDVAWIAGVMLVTFFFTCLFISIVHTFTALKHVARKDSAEKTERVRFMRTPPPRRR